MSKILENFILQLGFAFGLLALMGFLIWFLNRLLLQLLGYKVGRRTLLVTGAIGVPIHELGHLFFCLLFFHRIKAVRLFHLNPQDGTLGYVRHSYNKKNIFQQIGNFFIGVGPLLFGGAVIILLMFLWTPDISVVFNAGILQTIKSIFAPENLINLGWWVFIVFAMSIAFHMSLSWADVKGCLRGLIFIAPILFIVNVLLYIFSADWAAWFTNGLTSLSVLLVSFLAIAVLLLLVVVFVTALICIIKRRVTKRAANALAAHKAKKEGEPEQKEKVKKIAKKDDAPDITEEITAGQENDKDEIS